MFTLDEIRMRELEKLLTCDCSACVAERDEKPNLVERWEEELERLKEGFVHIIV